MLNISFAFRICIDFCHNTLDLINSVNTSISKIKIKYSKEHSLLHNQKKSVKLLNQVPCGNEFPTCKFIAESHKNKLLLSEQKTLVKSLKVDIDELLTVFGLLIMSTIIFFVAFLVSTLFCGRRWGEYLVMGA